MEARLPYNWLSLRLEPTESLNIDFADEAVRHQFNSWLIDPKTTGNRSAGWNFTGKHGYSMWTSDVYHRNPRSSSTTGVSPAGTVTFSVDSRCLYWKGNDRGFTKVWPSVGNDGLPRDVWPYILIEYPVAIFRLMGKILEKYAGPHAELKVVGGFFVTGIEGWRLRPGSPQFCYDTYDLKWVGRQGGPTSGKPWLPWQEPKTFSGAVLKVDPENLVFDAREFVQNPDRCALRLVRFIYAAFGFYEEVIPREFDRQAGVLRLLPARQSCLSVPGGTASTTDSRGHCIYCRPGTAAMTSPHPWGSGSAAGHP